MGLPGVPAEHGATDCHDPHLVRELAEQGAAPTRSAGWFDQRDLDTDHCMEGCGTCGLLRGVIPHILPRGPTRWIQRAKFLGQGMRFCNKLGGEAVLLSFCIAAFGHRHADSGERFMIDA